MFRIPVAHRLGEYADGSGVLVVWRVDGGRREEKHADTRACV